MRILLVEDDRMIGTSLVHGLQDAGYAVDWLQDGDMAERALQDEEAKYSVALVDWGLPSRSGLDVLRALRKRHDSLPVLMITARDSIDDRVAGLDGGADDYLVKPFDLAEVLARIRNLLRRPANRNESLLTNGILSLDTMTRRARRDDREYELTAREFALLFALMKRPGAVLSRAHLEEHLYSWSDAVESNAVEFLIHGVRKKLGVDVIQNVRGLGWRVAARP
jgi:two-component system, OmpR family, response regulator